MPSKKPPVSRTFRLPHDINKELNQRAKKEHISAQAYVVRMLEAKFAEDKQPS